MNDLKKLKAVITSHYFIYGLCILIETILLIRIYLYLFEYFPPITILAILTSLGIILSVINKDETADVKLPWIIITLSFPIVGPFLYLIFKNNNLNKAKFMRYEKSKEISKKYQNSSVLKKLKKENYDVYLQANYIFKNSQSSLFDDSLVTYYKIGEEFFEQLIDELKKAEKFIFMEYFIIEEGVMWNAILEILKEKAKSGVEVYVMYDDFGCMFTLEDKYYRDLEKFGIHSITSNRLNNSLTNLHNQRDHRKITVIDGKVGFTGGVNLADEYINKKVVHGHWKDVAIKIEGNGTRNLSAIFIDMWNTQSKEQIEHDKYMNVNSKVKKSNGIIISYGTGPGTLYKEEMAKRVYMNMINNAKKYLYITTPYLICDTEFLNALKMASEKGVDVRIITPHIPDKKTVFLMTESNYTSLISSGVKIYEYTNGFIHAKNFICDDIYAICGTINLDYRSLVYHFECATWMYNTNNIKDMKKDFEETLKISQEITLEDAKLKGRKKLLAEVLKVFSPLL